MARIHQALKHGHQATNVLDVQSQCRLLQDEEVPGQRSTWHLTGSDQIRIFPLHRSGLETTEQVGHQLDPLSLATTQGRTDLTQLKVFQTGIPKGFQRTTKTVLVGEELDALRHGQLQHLGDRLALVSNLERTRIETFSTTGLAVHRGSGQEVHFHLHHSGSFAMGASTLSRIETEAPRAVTTHPRFGHLGE